MIKIEEIKDIEALNGIYRTIAELTSFDDCLVLYKNLKGLSVSFPTKLYDPDYLKDVIREELNKNDKLSKEKIQLLAISFDYSERHIRRYIKEVKSEMGFK
ncbi:MAG TPA: hypothetical protein H9829_11095 [Candidatus Tetragenococcus pullicola]|nr:hypothetical protein [Candidatus Tetragenococcus pullicola]